MTIATATGVTLVGNMVVNNGSATFRIRRLSASTVSVTRLESTALITKDYESSAQTITAAGTLTLAHGLGVEPKFVIFFLECTSAELGYSVGDRVGFSLNSTTASSRFSQYTFDATNVRWQFTDNGNVILLGNKSTGVVAGITLTSWRLYIRAFA